MLARLALQESVPFYPQGCAVKNSNTKFDLKAKSVITIRVIYFSFVRFQQLDSEVKTYNSPKMAYLQNLGAFNDVIFIT